MQMKISATLAALVLALVPAASAFAQCMDMKSESAMSCQDGYVWDGDSRACVPRTTS